MKRIKFAFAPFVVFILLAVLPACAYKPVYNGEFIETGLADLKRYWIPDLKVVRFDATAKEFAATMAGEGKTSGTFWIDSNGKVVNVEITGSEPPGVFDRATISDISGRSYTPGPGNSARRPAMVRFETTFRIDRKEAQAISDLLVTEKERQ